jgi:hypothetical protein
VLTTVIPIATVTKQFWAAKPNIMATTLNHTIATSYTSPASRTSVFASFINWCEAQQFNRVLWIGIALMAHGSILAPLTSMVVLTTVNSLPLFILTIASMAMALVVNLAAQPTKVTIPVFFLSVLIDLGIIIASLAA